MSNLSYQPNIKDLLEIFWSSSRLKYQFFAPLVLFIPVTFFESGFLPFVILVMTLCSLVCYFSIRNFLKAKKGEPAFEGDFEDYAKADFKKQMERKHLRILILPVTLKQMFILILLMFAMFITLSNFM